MFCLVRFFKSQLNLLGPRQRWKERMDKDSKELGIENGVELAKERDQWTSVCCGNGPKWLVKHHKTNKQTNNK